MIKAPVPKVNYNLEAQAVTALPVTDTVTVRVKRNLSLPHIKNAAKRSEELARLERENQGAAFGPIFEDFRSEWLSAVISSAAGMEAYLNELIDRHGRDPDDPLWGNEKLSKKTKNFVATIFQRELDTGARTFQSAQLVCELRHKIMHFHPRFDDENKISEELERDLPKLKQCLFVDAGAPFFPMRCVSSAYSTWAVSSALSFIKELDRIVGEDRFAKHFGEIEKSLSPR